MKRIFILCAAALTLTLAAPVLAAGVPDSYYPIDVARSEDGREIRKTYELTPDQDPDRIPREDFIQGDMAFSLTDLLKEEVPETETRQESRTVTAASQTGDMDTVLASLPQDKAYSSEDGFAGSLTLQRDSVKVNPRQTAGRKAVTVTRSYPDLSGQDTAAIPKTVQENGATLALTGIQWQTDNSIPVGGVSIGNRFTAVCTYSGTVTANAVSGYQVTATYAGTVSRTVSAKTRYIAVFTGTPLAPTVPPTPEATETPATGEASAPPDYVVRPSDSDPPPPSLHIADRDEGGSPAAAPTAAPDQATETGSAFRWSYVLFPLAGVAAAGAGIGIAILIKSRQADDEDDDDGPEDDGEDADE